MRPKPPQIACFDTAFHHDVAPVVARFALPREYVAEGVARYSFRACPMSNLAGAGEGYTGVRQPAVVVAHFGNGARLCAMRAGRSIDTTMGFTALDGLPMGIRCGALDPGVILHLFQERDMFPFVAKT